MRKTWGFFFFFFFFFFVIPKSLKVQVWKKFKLGWVPQYFITFQIFQIKFTFTWVQTDALVILCFLEFEDKNVDILWNVKTKIVDIFETTAVKCYKYFMYIINGFCVVIIFKFHMPQGPIHHNNIFPAIPKIVKMAVNFTKWGRNMR